jgi:hypothetical protein
MGVLSDLTLPTPPFLYLHRCQGDGAGVGKGRQIAALIREFFETGGKRTLWVSTR